VNLPNLKFHRAMLALRTPARPLVTVTWDSGISLWGGVSIQDPEAFVRGASHLRPTPAR